MEALWEINSSAILGEIKYGRHWTTGSDRQREWSYLRNFLADCHYFGVYYKGFEGAQSIGEVFCDNKQCVNQVNQLKIILITN